jgi:hypothetical protein
MQNLKEHQKYQIQSTKSHEINLIGTCATHKSRIFEKFKMEIFLPVKKQISNKYIYKLINCVSPTGQLNHLERGLSWTVYICN